MKSTFLARGKTYEVFQPGAKVEVVVVAMSGAEICKIYVTTANWYMTYQIQKLSESDMPRHGKDQAKTYLMSNQFFMAFQEDVGGCLRVASCSIEVVEVTCNGIGVASRAMTRTSEIKVITQICWENTDIDLPGVPPSLNIATPLRGYPWSKAFWKVQREQSRDGRNPDNVGWVLTINIMRDRQEAHPPAFVEVKLVSCDKRDDTDDHAVFAIFTRHVHELRGTFRFGPFDLKAFHDSPYGAFGFFLCLTSWEEIL